MLQEYRLPSLGDGVTGKVTEIKIKPGDNIAKEQIIIVVGTDKVDAEMPADADGTVQEVAVKIGDEVKEGDLIMKYTAAAGAAAPAPAPKVEAAAAQATQAAVQVVAAKAEPAPTSTAKVAAKSNLRISPLARKRAKELGINISDVQAPDGADRISYKDVIDFAKKKMDSPSGGGGGAFGPAFKKLPDFAKYGEIERKPLSRITELTSDNLTYTWNTAPHAWMMEKADISNLENSRQKYKDQVKAAGGALTTTVILAKAIVSVLKKFPTVNSTIDLEKKEVVFKSYYNIGIAVDTPRGLLVPVLRNVDKKSLTELSIELTELSTRTRDGKNKPDDMEGSTFSISNVGGIGSTSIIPIVNWPNSVLLGITAAQKEAVWNEDMQAFEPRLMMPMTLAFDHRIINGADASRFLKELKLILEDPFLGWL